MLHHGVKNCYKEGPPYHLTTLTPCRGKLRLSSTSSASMQHLLHRNDDQWGRPTNLHDKYSSTMSGDAQRTSTQLHPSMKVGMPYEPPLHFTTFLSAFIQGGEEYGYDHTDHSTVESEEAILSMAPATCYTAIPPLPLLPCQDRCHQHTALGGCGCCGWGDWRAIVISFHIDLFDLLFN